MRGGFGPYISLRMRVGNTVELQDFYHPCILYGWYYIYKDFKGATTFNTFHLWS